MPLVTIKLFKDELSESRVKDLIQQVTEALIPFVGEGLRGNTWVLVEEVSSGAWGMAEKRSVSKMSALFSHGSEESVRPCLNWGVRRLP